MPQGKKEKRKKNSLLSRRKLHFIKLIPPDVKKIGVGEYLIPPHT
jgi:hypothetical protein